MVYLEHSGSKFWRCEVSDDGSSVALTYGKCGANGRTMKKDFPGADKAEEYATKQEASKRQKGYVDAADPSNSNKSNAPTPTKKRKANPTTSAVTPSPPAKKKGLSGHAAPDMTTTAAATDGTVLVDTGVAGIDAALASRAAVVDNFHARLALVDPSKNSDKYYIMQVLRDESPAPPAAKKKKGGHQDSYYFYTRWGRTGTGGQAKLDGPWGSLASARTSFEKTFKQKTAKAFDAANAGEKPLPGKYEYLAEKVASNDDAYWFYHLQNDPMGKADGWYRYDQSNRDEVETLYETYVAANKPDRLSTRFITSESSGFQYRVDMKSGIQTNVQSGKQRPIRRTEDGKAPRTMRDLVVDSDSDDTFELAQAAPAASNTKKNFNKRNLFYDSDSDDDDDVVAAAAAPAITAGIVDSAASSRLQGGSIYEDYDVMLNQTNLGANNNKFYKIQLIETSLGVSLFTKWGRVGEPGSTQEQGPFVDGDRAAKEFEKKFKAKTGNKWEDRANFVSKKGKYTLVEMEADEEKVAAAQAASAVNVKVLPCQLAPSTKALVDLIFNEDMFNSAMSNMNLDPKKLPLGALSQTQIQKGYAVLGKLETELEVCGARPRELMDLTSEFYTVIPHAFGRKRGPVLDTKELVGGKYEILNTLTDIEAAQAMQKRVQQQQTASTQAHVSDLNYQQLSADLTLLDPDKDADYKLIKNYFDNTNDSGSHHGKMELRQVWRVNRHKEDQRFGHHSDLKERQLLWHGTNVAVVAAILKSGLRIMPHSGGRVGRGIYLADQHQKSAWYTQGAKGTTIMLLVEAALGKSHRILRDDPSLIRAPPGSHSVLAQGRSQPVNHVELDIDGKSVLVPQGKPKELAAARGSSFEHNEFLIYQESQHRIRYILTFDEQ